MKGEECGYTLVELLVVMLVFAIVMTLVSVSFNRIVRSSSIIMKSAETDIGGLIGLELMRSDLEAAGFGLPWTVPSEVTYSETPEDDLPLVNGCPNTRPSRFDDRKDPDFPNTPVPYRVGNQVGYHGSDYLVLKGTPLGASSVSKSWCYLNYSSTGAVLKPSRVEPALQSGGGDRVIVVKTGAGSGGATRELLTAGTVFSLTFNTPLPEAFSPKGKSDNFMVYGVAPADDNGHLLSFPFNRADYYINRPDSISPNCNPFTGMLYKTTMNQNGSHTYYPLLDCAADMQVVLYWDSNGDGNIDYRSERVEEGAANPAELRARLKEIRVYILAQLGKRDPAYLYPVADPDRAVLVGDLVRNADSAMVIGRVWTARQMAEAFGAEWRNYRWKLYTIVVQPKNL